MTLVTDNGRDGPRVHVLAIGVGSYRHLPGGSEPRVGQDLFGLRQLTGPPLSAQMFVDWVARIHHPQAALGTIDLLISGQGHRSADGPAEAAAIEVPTAANVRAAFERWYAACDTDERNVALLYFCGHGVERESLFLLLEDFGASSLRLLENAIDIDQTYRGMARNRAREQYLFVDACREIPFQALRMLSGSAMVLVTPELVGDPRLDTAMMLATSGGAKAYGLTGEATRFTRALIEALDGLGARLEGPQWVVDVPSVQRAITMLLRLGDEAPVQVPSMRGTGVGVIHQLDRAPIVPIDLFCKPPTAFQGAVLTLQGLLMLPLSSGAPPWPSGPTRTTTGWTAQVPADIYTLSVDFPAGELARQQKSLAVLPPGISDALEMVP